MVSTLPYLQKKRVKRKDTCTDHRIAWVKYVDQQNNLAYYIPLFYVPRSGIVNTSCSSSKGCQAMAASEGREEEDGDDD